MGIVVVAALAANVAALAPVKLAPFHGLPSSGREPHITTPLRENAAVQRGKIAHRMAEMGPIASVRRRLRHARSTSNNCRNDAVPRTAERCQKRSSGAQSPDG